MPGSVVPLAMFFFSTNYDNSSTVKLTPGSTTDNVLRLITLEKTLFSILALKNLSVSNHNDKGPSELKVLAK